MSIPGRFGDRRRIRVGLLGGTFDPAHAGHLQIAVAMRRMLRLDQVWLMVSPGNPLKPRHAMSSHADRLASASLIADGRRIIATDIEAKLGTCYSTDTLAALRRRFPRVLFVWLMGADALAQLPRWHHWIRLIHLVPIAVHARPGADRAALAGMAAHRWRHARLRPPALSAAGGWMFLPLAHHATSSTALRAAGLGLNSGHRRQ